MYDSLQNNQKSKHSRRIILKQLGRVTGAIAAGIVLGMEGMHQAFAADQPNYIPCPASGNIQVNWGQNNPNCANSSFYYLELWSYAGGGILNSSQCCPHYINWHGCSSNASGYTRVSCSGGALN